MNTKTERATYRDLVSKALKEREKNEPHIRRYKGIMSKMVSKMTKTQLRDFMSGYLIPRGFRKIKIMNMPFKDLEELFQKIMEI